MRAYLLIQAEPGRESLAERLMKVPGVSAAENVTGAYDAIALAVAPTTRQLFESVIERILKLPGVTRALPAPLLRRATEHPKTETEPSGEEPGSGDRAA